MRITELGGIVCVCCGRSDVPLLRLMAAMSPNLRACAVCLARYGAAVLAREADTILATAQPRRPVALGRCLHCGQPTLDAGAWCATCNAELQRLRGGA